MYAFVHFYVVCCLLVFAIRFHYRSGSRSQLAVLAFAGRICECNFSIFVGWKHTEMWVKLGDVFVGICIPDLMFNEEEKEFGQFELSID